MLYGKLFRFLCHRRYFCSNRESLQQLGKKVAIPSSPQEAILERVPNSYPDSLYVARFVAPEFTSLCPVTGQPDFAHLVIDYIPQKWLLESCTLFVAKSIEKLVEPIWLRIGGYWYPRGGIPIDVFYQTGEPPKGVWIPDQGVASYRGRGGMH
ncbi:NADPH-dependent 7-cyano-7-deazaguanine reductase [Galdieria sulphuraria]|nr:NADPH-dependent 7-cyano-7-deazaguanine reductase [Galdieria sulphuraria]